MAFITQAELENLNLPSLVRSFIGTDAGAFAAAEAAAAEIIVAETGVENPADANNAPAWSKLPAAWLIFQIIVTRNTAVGKEYVDLASRLYDRALAQLARHKTKRVSTTSPTTGEIDGLYSW